MKTLSLPPAVSDRQPTLPPDNSTVVIIGANGAGKSRFAARMARDAGERAYTLSALKALYQPQTIAQVNESASIIDRRYTEAIATGMTSPELTSQLDRLLTLLMRDEMLNLIDYKLSRTGAHPDEQLPSTPLDSVIATWQHIFPDNKILISSGSLLFNRVGSDNSDAYTPVKLSAGEKAVIYYIAALTYAPQGAAVFVDSPEMFLHPTVMQSLWNRLAQLRPDCNFIFTTHDLDFATSRQDAAVIWVRSFDASATRWDYAILPAKTPLTEEIFSAIMGPRKPVMFIEGDGKNSIDSKLYPLIFPDFTIRALGSCNKVIEATRTFNDLNSFHKLDSYGIVDRDRRDVKEVEYLRGKKIMVPEVAEVENILLLEGVIRAVARYCGKNHDRVFGRVKRYIISQFGIEIRTQALLHTRHRVKRIVECRIDGRFNSIAMLENHLRSLPTEINARGMYDNFCARFKKMHNSGDYAAILRVYNQKAMLPGCNVAGLCGLHNKDEYIATITKILRLNGPDAESIRTAVRRCFCIHSSRPDIMIPADESTEDMD